MTWTSIWKSLVLSMTDKIDLIVAENQDVWKTRSAFFSWLKSIIRKGWSKSPVRLKHLKKRAMRVPNTNPRSMKRFPFVNAYKCEICQQVFKQNEVEVDHILEETASLTSLDDVRSCVEKLLVVADSDLRILCKGCHSCTTLSQRLGITFEEALLEQKIIALLRDKKKCLDVLAQNGYTGVAVSNQAKRRALLREILKGEKQ